MSTTQYPGVLSQHQRQARGFVAKSLASGPLTTGANNFGSDQTEGGLDAGIDRQSPPGGFRGAAAMT